MGCISALGLLPLLGSFTMDSLILVSSSKL